MKKALPLLLCLILVMTTTGCAGGKSSTFSSWNAFGNSNAQIFDKTWGLRY